MFTLKLSKPWLKSITFGLSLGLASAAISAEPEQCKEIRFTDPGWTDINSTNGIAVTLFEALGYSPTVELLGVPVGYESMKNGEIDVFLGNWMPGQSKFIEQYKDSIEVLKTNLPDAKFTLAVPTSAWEKGVKDFADLAKFGSEFGKKIYGIEAGAPANQKLQSMIDAGEFDLKGWKLVESGEQAMLSQVSRSVSRDKPIVFLAWAPHPMNINFDIKYLSGGDKYFGPNYGGATVHTVTRKGYSSDCPNASKLLSNLSFTLAMESKIMNGILDEGKEAKEAAAEWIKENPDSLASWLEGVQTISGKPGLAAVKSALDI